MSAALVLATIALAGAPGVEEVRIAVPDMTLSGVDENLGRILTEIVTTEMSNLEGVSVIGSSDIATMLGFEQQKLLLSCSDDVSCIAEIGGALGVDLLLVSDLGLVGKTYVINLKLIDTTEVKVLKRVYKVVPGEPDALIEAVRDLLPEVLAVVTLGAKATASAQPKEAPTPESKGEPKPDVAMTAGVSPPTTDAAPRAAWPMWTLIGVGGASVILGGVVRVRANRDDDAAWSSYTVSEDSPRRLNVHPTETGDRLADAAAKSRVALLFWVVGGLAGAGGLAWLLLDGSDQPASSVEVTPVATEAGAAIVVHGSF
ncbi:MAG: hypothetical protein V3T05_11190 [Myxococcota bacterium]